MAVVYTAIGFVEMNRMHEWGGLSLKGIQKGAGDKGVEERLVSQALRYFFPSHAFLHGIFIIYNP